MKLAVVISYIVSIISNIILSIIIYLTNHSYKWIGYLIHFLLLFSIFYSLKLLFLPSSKIVKKYITITKFFTLVLMSSTIFYFAIFVYMFVQKVDKEISYFYGFCVLIWSLYHYILISIIFSYIQAKWKTGQPVEVVAFERESDQSPYLSGSFVISSLEQTAPAGDDATYNGALENNGEVDIDESALTGEAI